VDRLGKEDLLRAAGFLPEQGTPLLTGSLPNSPSPEGSDRPARGRASLGGQPQDGPVAEGQAARVCAPAGTVRLLCAHLSAADKRLV